MLQEGLLGQYLSGWKEVHVNSEIRSIAVQVKDYLGLGGMCRETCELCGNKANRRGKLITLSLAPFIPFVPLRSLPVISFPAFLPGCHGHCWPHRHGDGEGRPSTGGMLEKDLDGRLQGPHRQGKFSSLYVASVPSHIQKGHIAVLEGIVLHGWSPLRRGLALVAKWFLIIRKAKLVQSCVVNPPPLQTVCTVWTLDNRKATVVVLLKHCIHVASCMPQ